MHACMDTDLGEDSIGHANLMHLSRHKLYIVASDIAHDLLK